VANMSNLNHFSESIEKKFQKKDEKKRKKMKVNSRRVFDLQKIISQKGKTSRQK